MRKYSINIFYKFKPFIPRWLQIAIRRQIVQYRLTRYSHIWPINEKAGAPPENWPGWPEGKRFALILTHDVDTSKGQDRCRNLAQLEMKLGFRSSFNFVPRRYKVSAELRNFLTEHGFEVGVHGLYHDGQYYHSYRIWAERSRIINQYLKEWDSCGFRSPSMHHNLDWIRDLDIQYDCSTFDTDPFEPYSDSVGTIFPFWVKGNDEQKGYVELPYTLPQDFTLFIMLKEKGIDIWKRKLNWIIQKGGMALVIVHPDYMSFDGDGFGLEDYPSQYYVEFLQYIKTTYPEMYWHAPPMKLAKWWANQAFPLCQNVTAPSNIASLIMIPTLWQLNLFSNPLQVVDFFQYVL